MKSIDEPFWEKIILKKGLTSILELSKLTRVNRWTLSRLLHQNQTKVTNVTFNKLKTWIDKDER